MCTLDCNSSLNESSSSVLVPSNLVRRYVSMTLIQLFVWPFVYMNVLMLVTFSRKQAFKTESRYILFAHTLQTDLVFLLLTNFIVVLSYNNILLPLVFCIPFCVIMEALTTTTPLIIATMCVERYVAICMPLRHGTISTSRRTITVIVIIWIVSFINPLLDLCILFANVSQEYLSELTFCHYEILTPEKWQRLMRGGLCIVAFVFTLLVEFFCYFMIVTAARAASVDKKSASKGVRTIFLHMLQLTLCTFENFCPYVEDIIIEIDFQLYLTVSYFNFVTFDIIARAISPLVYGLRDEKFYAALVQYAKFRQNHISSENKEINIIL